MTSARDVAIVVLLVLLPTLVALAIHTATTPAGYCSLAAWNQRQADIAWESGDPDHDIYRDLADVNDRKCQR